MPIKVRRRIVRWGHSFGIRLTRAEVERLGLKADDLADVEVSGKPRKVDLSGLPQFHWGPNASRDHDEIIGEGLLADR